MYLKARLSDTSHVGVQPYDHLQYEHTYICTCTSSFQWKEMHKEGAESSGLAADGVIVSFFTLHPSLLSI